MLLQVNNLRRVETLKHQKTFFQRFLAFVCSGAMLLNMVPVSAFAQGDVSQTPPPAQTEAGVATETPTPTPAAEEPQVETQAEDTVQPTPEPTPEPAPEPAAQPTPAAPQPRQVEVMPLDINSGTDGQTDPGNAGQSPAPAEPTSSTDPSAPPAVVEITITPEEEQELQVGDTLALTATVVPEGVTEPVIWESSNPAVAKVEPDPTGSRKATVTAVAGGKATITAACGGKEAACEVTVKGPITEIVAITPPEGITENGTVILVENLDKSFAFSANTTPVADYCTNSVMWTVTTGNSYVQIDQNGNLTFTDSCKASGLSNDTPVQVTVQAEAGNSVAPKQFVFRLDKKQNAITFDATTFTYGDDIQLQASATNNGEVTYELLQDNETGAQVGTDGKVTVNNAGSFTVKASSVDTGFYYSGLQEQLITVNKRPLTVTFTEPTSTISKISDGTTSLTQENQDALKNAFELNPEEIVNGDDVNLSVDVSAATFASDAVGPNEIDLSAVTFTLQGNDINKYALASTTGTGKCNATITPVEPTEKTNIDLITATGDVTIQTGVAFKVGTESANDGTYWYGGNGVPVTLADGYSLLAKNENGSAGASVVEYGYLTAASGNEFYVLDGQGIYTGPYTVTYKKDTTVPEIELTKVEAIKGDGSKMEANGQAIVFGKEVTYTISVTDDESGVDASAMYYAVADDKPAVGDSTAWQKITGTPTENGYVFTVTAPNAGTLFVKAADLVGNNGEGEFAPLVLEENAPTIELTVNGSAVTSGTDQITTGTAQDYALGLTVQDVDVATGIQQSGIQKVTYEIMQGDTPIVPAESLWEALNPPTTIAEINDSFLTKTASKQFSELADGVNLNGDYTLTITAVDFCGNSSSFTYTFKLDNTAPTVTAHMGGTANADGNYYYKADNGEITVIFTDANLAENTEANVYTATLKGEAGTEQTKSATVTAGSSTATVTFSATDVAKFADDTLTLTVSATDAAGNTNTELDTASKGLVVTDDGSGTFVLDKTAPVLEKVQAAGGNYYPNEKAVYFNTDFTLTFTVNDANYDSAKVQNRTQCTNDEPKATLNAAVADTITLTISGNADNARYKPAIQVEDKAGNQMVAAADLAAEGPQGVTVDANGVGTMATTFVLDTTLPVLVGVTTTENGNDYGEGVYYQGAFDATFEVEDANYDKTADDKRTYGKSVLTVTKDGVADTTPTIIDGNAENGNATKTVKVEGINTAKAVYRIKLEVVDKAGNKLTGGVTGGQNATTFTDGIATLKNRIMDNVAPVMTISYTDLEATHFYLEGEETGPATAYYNKDLEATFKVEDAGSLDETKLYVSRTKEGENDLDNRTFGAGKDPTVPSKTFNSAEIPDLTITAQPDNDGVYVYTVYGEDKAGNPLTVVENDYSGKGEPNKKTGCNSQNAYTGAPKAMDTVAPTATISYTELDATHFYTDGERTNAYYNHGFTATFAFADTYGTTDKSYNMDESKLHYMQLLTEKTDNPIGTETTAATKTVSYTVADNASAENVHYAFIAYGEDKAGNPLTVTEQDTTAPGESTEYTNCADKYAPVTHKVLDMVAPTFTLAVDDPANDLSVAVDSQNRAYYNGDITATFTVNDANLDSKKVGTATAARSGMDFNYDEADVEWKPISLTKSDAVEAENTRTLTQTVSADGIYRFEIEGEDRAGNRLIQSAEEAAETDFRATLPQTTAGQFWTNLKVRDTLAPRLDIALSDGETFYTAILGEPSEQQNTYYNITANAPYRRASDASGTLTKTDCSPVSVIYTIDSTTAPQSEPGSPYNHDTLNLNFNGEQIFNFSTLVVRDRAGNSSTMPKAANKIYLDVTAPNVDELAPTISVVAHASGEGRGQAGTDLFRSTVTVRATVTDPGEGVRSSGLYQVYYRVLVNGEDQTGAVGVSGKGSVTQAGILGYGTSGSEYESLEGVDEAITSQDVIDFTFDENTFNYNDVKIYVWAEDNSGNMVTEDAAAHYFFGIDITAPKIDVSYDNNDAQNEKYFKADRTATVVVTERNFDPNNTVITTETSNISGWSYAAGSSANGDDDTWTCTVGYTEDGDYTFDVTTTDLLGFEATEVNYGDSVAPQEFTIDKTNPVINISFNNNDVRNGKYYNDTRTATVNIEEHNFSTDGVDLTTTANIQEGSVTAPGASGWSSNGDTNTATVPFTQDGNYTMHVECVDLAGNEAEPEDVDEFVVDTTAPELEITGVEDHMAYSGDVAPAITYHDINYDPSSANVSIVGVQHPEGENLTGTRTEDAFGGSFVCNNIEPVKENDDVYTATGVVSDMAGNETEVDIVFSVNRYGSTYMFAEDTQALLDNYYTNTPQELHVIEINVDSQVSNMVTTSLNGELRTLQQGTDYTVQESVPGWHQFDYTIGADNFTGEGVYDVTLSSVDEAGNTSSNRAIKENEGATSDMPIAFVVDMTPPANVVTGVEENEQYIAAERTVMINYEDNIGMASLTLYVNDEAVAEYDAEDLAGMNGTVQYTAQASNHWQNFKVVSSDLAGNTSDETTVRYLLTDNLLIQYFNNKPIFFGSLIALAAVVVVIILLVRRKKKQTVTQ